MKLAICTATMCDIQESNYQYGPGEIPSFTAHATTNPRVYVHRNTIEQNLGVVSAYQKLYEKTTEEILFYTHDDVVCREGGWDERVISEFEDPKVGLVGFGGASRHGTDELYKTPYRLQQLVRSGYRSNVDDAETHGARFEGSCDVVVLDGFVIAVRRSLLDCFGGWAWMADGCNFFCYDYAISALARRCGYRIRVVGVRCHHYGGRTSTKDVKEIVGQEAYDKSHKWFYNEFRNEMPARM